MQFLQKRRVLLVLSAFVAINFTNCSKDDTEKLTDGPWTLKKINNLDATTFLAALSFGTLSDADFTMEFEEDGDFINAVIYTYTDGTTDSDTYTGTWEWEDTDEDVLVVSSDGYTQRFEVQELTKSKLILNQDSFGTPDDPSDDWEMEFER